MYGISSSYDEETISAKAIASVFGGREVGTFRTDLRKGSGNVLIDLLLREFIPMQLAVHIFYSYRSPPIQLQNS